MWSKSIVISLLILIVMMLVSCESTKRFTSAKTKTKTIDTSVKPTAPQKSQKTIDYYTSQNLTEQQEKLIEYAGSFLGTRYCYGGSSVPCFDCSGFVNFVFSYIGINLPRTSREQYYAGIDINIANAKPGDLVFFGDGNRINHVGIYIGDNKMIHSSTSKGVIIQSLDESYYKSRFAGIKRVLK